MWVLSSFIASLAWAQPAPSDQPAADPPAAKPASQPTPPEPAKSPAEELFDRGLKDMLAGRYDSGCPALAESYKMEPLPGALFTLAECELGWGRLATALGHYQQYLSQYERMASGSKLKQAQRAEVAESKVDELKGRVPRLKLVSGASLPEGTVVKRDGTVVPPAVMGVAVPVDPGAHTIVLEPPAGKGQPNTQSITMYESQERELVLVLEEPDEPPVSASSLRVAAYITGGVGVAALIAGFVAGGVTLGHKSTIEDNCDGLFCNQQGLDAADAAATSGTVADVGISVGLIAVGAAVTMYLLAPVIDPEPAADADAEDDAQLRLLPVGDIALHSDATGTPRARVMLGLAGAW